MGHYGRAWLTRVDKRLRLYQSWCRIATFIKVDFDECLNMIDISKLTYIKVVDCGIEELCDIAMLIKVELLYNMYIALINGDVVF